MLDTLIATHTHYQKRDYNLHLRLLLSADEWWWLLRAAMSRVSVATHRHAGISVGIELLDLEKILHLLLLST